MTYYFYCSELARYQRNDWPRPKPLKPENIEWMRKMILEFSILKPHEVVE